MSSPSSADSSPGTICPSPCRYVSGSPGAEEERVVDAHDVSVRDLHGASAYHETIRGGWPSGPTSERARARLPVAPAPPQDPLPGERERQRDEVPRAVPDRQRLATPDLDHLRVGERELRQVAARDRLEPTARRLREGRQELGARRRELLSALAET